MQKHENFYLDNRLHVEFFRELFNGANRLAEIRVQGVVVWANGGPGSPEEAEKNVRVGFEGVEGLRNLRRQLRAEKSFLYSKCAETTKKYMEKADELSQTEGMLSDLLERFYLDQDKKG